MFCSLLPSLTVGRIKSRKANPSDDGGGQLRDLIKELGPTFIKFGQILTTRAECPESLRRELDKLQDISPPFSYEQVEEIIEQELGAPIGRLFFSFDKEPIASMALAQLHQAWLREGEGTIKVAVKVQRPGLESLIELDIAVLEVFARIIPRFFPRAKSLNLLDIIDSFGTILRKETDFVLQGRQQGSLAKNFERDRTVKVPKVYWDYTAKRVMVTEFVEGVRISNIEELDKAGLDRYELARNITKAYTKQIFEDAFLPADPQPSNIVVSKDNAICFLDFGMMEHVDETLLDDLKELLVALLHDTNAAKVAKQLMVLHIGSPQDVDYPRMELAIRTFIAQHFEDHEISFGVGYVLNKLLDEAFRFGVRLPQPLLSASKALLRVERLASKLYPVFNTRNMLDKYVNQRRRENALERIDPLNLRKPGKFASDLLDTAHDTVDLAKVFPRRATNIITKIDHGELEVRLREPREREHTAVYILIGALIIGLILLAALY